MKYNIRMKRNWWERTGKTYEERFTKWQRFWFAITHLHTNAYLWYLRKTGHKGIRFNKEGLVLWKNMDMTKQATLMDCYNRLINMEKEDEV